MSVVICIEGIAGQVTTKPELAGTATRATYLKSYDPEAHDGRGDLVATHELAEAQRFADHDEAMRVYLQQPASRPWRGDGQANRPACAFTISVVAVPDDDVTPGALAEEWVERAAIMEFDGGEQRAEAEIRAWALMRDKYGTEACARAQDIIDLSEELT